jgi:hypothetical protein
VRRTRPSRPSTSRATKSGTDVDTLLARDKKR